LRGQQMRKDMREGQRDAPFNETGKNTKEDCMAAIKKQLGGLVDSREQKKNRENTSPETNWGEKNRPAKKWWGGFFFHRDGHICFLMENEGPERSLSGDIRTGLRVLQGGRRGICESMRPLAGKGKLATGRNHGDRMGPNWKGEMGEHG